MLDARHLVKRFFGAAAVSDVSLTLQPGEIVGYLGPNGSGKTTTVKILTGLMESTSGTVTFRGRDIRDDRVEYKRHLGYVPEEPHLYPFLSGREYLELVGRLRDLPAMVLERKIASLLELFWMTDAGSASISAYSKGMKQKILIMAALLHDPDVLILDEPDSGLDVTSILVVRELIKELANRGKAVLYSSHVLENVEKVCARVIVLHHGSIVADASSDALRTRLAVASLEDVFSKLVLRVEPERTARDIADVVTSRG
jgi:ABC-2 type transport system ATP-binding protein